MTTIYQHSPNQVQWTNPSDRSADISPGPGQKDWDAACESLDGTECPEHPSNCPVGENDTSEEFLVPKPEDDLDSSSEDYLDPGYIPQVI